MLCDSCERHRFPEIFSDSRKHMKTTTSVTKASDDGKTSANLTNASDESTDNKQHTDVKFVRNELLSYVQFYRDRANADALKRVMHGFYSAESMGGSRKSAPGGGAWQGGK